MYQPMREF
jgi:hypothetical protein